MLQVRWKSLWHVHNFLTNQLIKEFWKSVHICQSYYQSQTSIVAYFFWDSIYFYFVWCFKDGSNSEKNFVWLFCVTECMLIVHSRGALLSWVMSYITDAVSEAGKQTGPVKEEGCIVDRLLADIRQGTTLRRSGSTRRSKRSSATSPPKELPEMYSQDQDSRINTINA